MEIITLRELKPYSFNDLVASFNLKDDNQDQKLKEIIKKLLLLKILKTTNNNSNFDQPDIDALSNTQVYKFDYVGIFIIEKCCLFIYPKYMSEESIEKDAANGYLKFKQIIKVILKYQKQVLNYQLNGNEINDNFNLLKFTIDLFENYYQHGLYHSDQQIIELNGSGEILWDQTINFQQAYWSNKRPIYLDLITSQQVIDNDNLFTQLHQVILTQCSLELKPILEALNIETIILSSDEIDEYGSPDYLTHQIINEQRNQFINWKQSILAQMLNYLKNTHGQENQDNFAFLGSCKFNLIWEAACASVYQSDLKKTIKELNLKPVNNQDLNKLLIDLIPKPIWIKHQVSDTLIPDLIRIKDATFEIYDAKYYPVKFDEEKQKISNHPGVNDLIKQYLYEQAYQQLIEQNNLKVTNTFLFPSEINEEQKMIGQAKIELFPKFYSQLSNQRYKLQNINICLLSPYKLFKKYLES